MTDFMHISIDNTLFLLSDPLIDDIGSVKLAVPRGIDDNELDGEEEGQKKVAAPILNETVYMGWLTATMV